ncbi:MAG TPA: hypothetical protein VIB59_04510 [Solirubrobacteraceae bacterium]|jgi:hypothetical protein
MGLALGTAAVVLVVLLWELARPAVMRALARARAALAERGTENGGGYDPGRERRAEQRARELLRSCVPEREWQMYDELGLISLEGPVRAADEEGVPPAYAYLIYPHKPIVAYVPASGELLSEYCVAFPDESRPYGSARLPDADDVLAKWMALTGDERRLIGEANMHLPGRQVDPDRVRRDLARLARWERERTARSARSAGHGVRDGNVAAA